MRAEILCATEFAQSHPTDTGRRLEALPADVCAEFLATLPAGAIVPILMSMHVMHAAQCLAALPVDVAAAVARELPLDFTSRVLRVMTRADADRLITEIPARQRERITRVLNYPAGTAGGIMDPIVLTVTDDLRVRDARRTFQRAAHSSYYYVYVVDRDDRLVGVMDLRELFESDKDERVRSVMRTHPVSVSPLTELESLATHPSWKDVDALPVTDRQSKLLGFVRHRTVRRKLVPTGEVRLDHVGTTLTRIGEMYWSTMGAFVAMLATAANPGDTALGGRSHP